MMKLHNRWTGNNSISVILDTTHDEFEMLVRVIGMLGFSCFVYYSAKCVWLSRAVSIDEAYEIDKLMEVINEGLM